TGTSALYNAYAYRHKRAQNTRHIKGMGTKCQELAKAWAGYK
ncbi:8314_t:CDS:1, partial [Gigaspora rosea]